MIASIPRLRAGFSKRVSETECGWKTYAKFLEDIRGVIREFGLTELENAGNSTIKDRYIAIHGENAWEALLDK